MAYIIAHGTVNGYCKIPSPQSIGIEQNVLTDIRAQFDNTQTMLQKHFGYLIQMASNGVWISVVKLLFDGERSGGGAGFFAFSAFLPTNQYIQGSTLRNILNDLMNTYLSKIGGTSTKNRGVDWSFINEVTTKLDAQCTLRKKPINTHYQPSDKFAYVDINDNDLDKYLEKPFQPEYGQYKAVFLGSYLQHPNVLSSQTPLSIDLENEEYTIEWRDAETYSTKWKVSLPSTIRKKDIAQGEYTFSEQYYFPQTVHYCNGQRDDADNIISIVTPERKAIEYKLEIVPDVPGVITSLIAITAGIQDPRKSLDNKTLSFDGDEVEMTWTLKIGTNKDYKNVQREIRPIDYSKNASDTQWLYPIHLEKSKKISIIISKKETLRTSESREIVSFYNKTTGKKEYGTYDTQTKQLLFYIQENQEFWEIYDVRVKDGFQDQWKVSIERYPTPNYFEVKLSSKQEQPHGPSCNNRTIHIYVHDEKIGRKGIIVYDKNRKEIKCPPLKKEKGNYTYKCDVSIPYDMHRSDLTITTTDGHKLEFESENSDSIIIYGETIFSRLGDWIRQQWLLLLVIVLAIMAISALGLFVYSKYFFHPKNEFIQQESTIVGDTASISNNESNSNDLHDFCQSSYLDSIYLSQCLEWNCKKINEAVGRCDSYAEKMKNDDTTAYSAYKKLVWLQKTRNRLDSCKWDALPDYVNKQNLEFQSRWILYANDSIREFLEKVIPFSNKRINFEKEIKNDTTFADKTFNEVKEIWSNCSSNNKDNSGNNTSENSGSYTSGGMGDSGDF